MRKLPVKKRRLSLNEKKTENEALEKQQQIQSLSRLVFVQLLTMGLGSGRHESEALRVHNQARQYFQGVDKYTPMPAVSGDIVGKFARD